MRQQIVVAMRGTEDVDSLPVAQRQMVRAAEIVLQPVVRGQVCGADAILVDRPEEVILVDIAECHARGQGQGGFLRLQRHDAAVQFERLGLGVDVDEVPCVARPDLAVEAGRADAGAIGADRHLVGQPAERQLARIGGRGREIEHQGIAGREIGVPGRGGIALPRADRRRAEIVDTKRGVEVPGLQFNDQAEASAGGADLFERSVLDAYPGPAIDQQQLPDRIPANVKEKAGSH